MRVRAHEAAAACSSASLGLYLWVVAGLSGLAGDAEDERGDVPGWVLITLMTAGLVTMLWAVAGKQLEQIFTTALSSVTGPGK